MVGCDFGGHEHVEDDETNPTVLTLEPNDERRRPATRSIGGAASVGGGDGTPVTGDSGERAAELAHTSAHLTAMTATGDDDGDGGAAAPEMAGGGGLLGGGGDGTPVTGDSGERAAGLLHTSAHLTAVTATGGDDGGGGATRMVLGRRRRRGGARGGGATRHGRPRERGKRKRRTRGSYL
jgi:hypothetical protein